MIYLFLKISYFIVRKVSILVLEIPFSNFTLWDFSTQKVIVIRSNFPLFWKKVWKHWHFKLGADKKQSKQYSVKSATKSHLMQQWSFQWKWEKTRLWWRKNNDIFLLIRKIVKFFHSDFSSFRKGFSFTQPKINSILNINSTETAFSDDFH